MIIKELSIESLNNNTIKEIIILLNKVWPSKDFNFESQKEKYLITHNNRNAIILLKDNKLIAHAIHFNRTILTNKGELDVLAMAEVCVNPVEQRKEYGRKIVQKVFNQIINNTSEVCLFQTGVPIFYEKLGGRIINNQFINSKCKDSPESNPWHDDYVMIYPSYYNWPDGIIDINGSGY